MAKRKAKQMDAILADTQKVSVNVLKPAEPEKEWISVYELARRLAELEYYGWGKDKIAFFAWKQNLVRWEPAKLRNATKEKAYKGRQLYDFHGFMKYITFLSGMDDNFIPVTIPDNGVYRRKFMIFTMRYKIQIFIVYGVVAVKPLDWLKCVNYLMVNNLANAIHLEEPVHWEYLYQHYIDKYKYRVFYRVNADYSLDYDPEHMRADLKAARRKDWYSIHEHKPQEEEADWVMPNGWIACMVRSTSGDNKHDKAPKCPVCRLCWYVPDQDKFLYRNQYAVSKMRKEGRSAYREVNNIEWWQYGEKGKTNRQE